MIDALTDILAVVDHLKLYEGKDGMFYAEWLIGDKLGTASYTGMESLLFWVRQHVEEINESNS